MGNTLALAAALLMPTLPAGAAECDTELGVRTFAAKCSICHSVEAGHHMTGPSLDGLNARRAGTIEGFNFSAALLASGIVWSAATLDPFLANPQTTVPGTAMPFGGIKNTAERAAVVCYLVTS
jgi:cytochrome c